MPDAAVDTPLAAVAVRPVRLALARTDEGKMICPRISPAGTACGDERGGMASSYYYYHHHHHHRTLRTGVCTLT